MQRANDDTITRNVADARRSSHSRSHTVPLVILIHGTWGHSSKWIQSGSLLQKVLRRRLPDNLEICPFRWSGRNSHHSRLEAAASLRARLQALLSENVSRKVFIVAHSHGGNVAGYALKAFEPIQSIGGLVLIAAPLLRVRARQLSEGGENIFRLMTFLLFLMALTLTVYWLGVLTADFLPFFAQAIIFVVVMSVLVTFIELCPPVVPRIRSWFVRTQASMLSRLTLEGIPRIPVFTIGIRRDEARRWLSTLRHIANLPALAFGLISRTANLYYPLLATGSVLLCMFIASVGGVPDEGSLSWYVLLAFIVFPIAFLILWVGAPLLQVLMLVIPRTLRSHSLGFGGESFMHNWLLDISVAADPPREWGDTDKWEVQESLLSRSSLLKHSRIYETEIVAERIADWIAARL